MGNEKTKQMTTTKVQSPADLIREAISGNADLDKMGKLLELQEKWEAKEARKAYHKAMSEFKASPPEIGKESEVSFNNVKYRYANLANVTGKINAELSKHELSATWQINQNGEGTVSVTCKITHSQGHSEETTLTAPPDVSGSKNKIQAIGSTITYLERYTLLALTGLATQDMDDDGRGGGSGGDLQPPAPKGTPAPRAPEKVHGAMPQASEKQGSAPEGGKNDQKGGFFDPKWMDAPDRYQAPSPDAVEAFIRSSQAGQFRAEADKWGISLKELRDFLTFCLRKYKSDQILKDIRPGILCWIRGDYGR